MTLNTAQRNLECFSSLWWGVSQWHSVGMAGICQALWGTESVTGVLLGSCNISAHSSAFPQRLLQLRSPSFRHKPFHQQKLTAFGGAGFRTGKKKLNMLNTSEKVTLDSGLINKLISFFINLHLLVVGMFQLQDERMQGKVPDLRNRN